MNPMHKNARETNHQPDCDIYKDGFTIVLALLFVQRVPFLDISL